MECEETMLSSLGKKCFIFFVVNSICLFNLMSLQLGNGNKENQLFPVKIMDNVKQVSASLSYSMIVKNDNTLWATGRNQYGKFGKGDDSLTETDDYVFIMNNIESVRTSVNFSLIIKTDHTLWISGLYPKMKNEKGDILWGETDEFIQIAGNVKAVSSGRRHIIFIKQDNSLWGLGSNAFGQLGLGISKGTVEPVKLKDHVYNIYADDDYSYYIDSHNYLFLVGDRTYLYDLEGKEIVSDSFVKVNENVKSISCGLLLKIDGTLYSFGYGGYGALGLGREGKYNEPIQFILNEVIKISSNQEHSLILLSNGNLLSCGGGSHFNHGSVGDGTKLPSYTPKLIMNNVIDCSAGEYFSLVIKEDYSLWGFGLNNDSENGYRL